MQAVRIPEPAAARQWREAMGLTRQQLADASGFSVGTIREYEAGQRGNGNEIEPTAWTRYRLACAALTAGISFDWRTVSLTTTETKSHKIKVG